MRLLKYLSQVSLLATTSYAANTTTFCKVDSTSPQWPTAQQWQALNASVSGALQVPYALGAVCHSELPAYNKQACSALLPVWDTTGLRSTNPWMVAYNDDACLPTSNVPCSTAGYPAYVIEANTPADIAAGLAFAKTYQVRLNVKGTGHDYPGRSAGPGSLSIWTHKLQGIQVTMGDPKAVQYGGVAAIKIAAGMRMGEIYAAAAQYKLTVVGGADADVGIGGWVTGGGHGPVSAIYGMGADQVLSMDVVTIDGRILTINETYYQDLFWAMRGGGGSTFAVLTSVTVKAYPSIPGTYYNFTYNTTVNSNTFWSMASYFQSYLPRLSTQGAMGYYYIFPFGSTTVKNQGIVTGLWIFPQKSVNQTLTAVSSLEASIRNASWATDKISISGTTVSFPDFTSAWLQTVKPETAGTDSRLGSWLLNGTAASNMANTQAAFRKLAPNSASGIIGHLVGPVNAKNVSIPGGGNAVLPAWRKAYTHVVAYRAWTAFNSAMKNSQTENLRNTAIPALKALNPGSGSYMNEADPTNPTWKNDFYGSNYARLLQIKQTYDPTGVFWCKPCVGNDLWTVTNGPSTDDSANWGVSQVGGNICKAS